MKNTPMMLGFFYPLSIRKILNISTEAYTFQGPSSMGFISEGLITREIWLGSAQVAQAGNIIGKVIF